MTMDDLLKKANVNEAKLRTHMNTITAEELGNISEPCYMPSVQMSYLTILKYMGLTENDYREFIKSFYLYDHQYAKFNMVKDLGTNVVLSAIYYFLKKKDIKTFFTCMLFLSIKFQGSATRKAFTKFCDPDLYMYTLNHLSKSHLYVREKTIAGALFWTTKNMVRIYQHDLEKFDNFENVGKFLYALRTRIQQSFNSFFGLYKKFYEEGVKISSDDSEEESPATSYLERGGHQIEVVVRNITVYKHVDQKALEDAKKLSSVSLSFVSQIVRGLCDVKYQDRLKLIFELFLRDVKKIDYICGVAFFDYVKSLMSIKRTKMEIYFKQQVAILLKEVATDVGIKTKLQSLTNQTQYNLSLFLAYYLTLCFRHTVCQ